MRIVVIGDIGWRDLYHLGDEAMTEAAVDMLRARGIEDITLVAGEPAAATDFYRLPAVPRLGFRASWSRERNDELLESISASLTRNEIEEGSSVAAIRDCDALIIAGGGNMNSRDYHLLYERLASTRIAAHYGKPVYVSSQTVGPMLTPEDRARVVEIADTARAFGCREAVTTELLRSHVTHPERVHHTLDDALVLATDDASRASAAELTSGKPYIVASFTDHHGTIWPSRRAYYKDIAQLCTTLANQHDVDVLLAPHAGSLDPDLRSRDQDGNDAIAALADSPRVRATRMITAREDVALIESAALSLSTRYHPLVFASALAAPAIAIAPSYYSSLRMRGAMRNVGLEAFILPTTSFHLVPDAAAEAMASAPGLAAHRAASRDAALALQTGWWDALVESITSDGPVNFDAHPGASTFTPAGEWSHVNEITMPVFDEYAQSADRRRQLHEKDKANRAEIARLTDELERTRSSLERYKQRKVIRLLDSLRRQPS